MAARQWRHFCLGAHELRSRNYRERVFSSSRMEINV